MRRGFVTIAMALAMCVFPGIAAAEEEKDPHAALIGKPAPDFDVDFSLNAKDKKLSDLKGKVVLVDFWAVWCGPCVRMFPHLRELHGKYNEQGLEVVGVTTYYEMFDFDKQTGRLTQSQQKLSREQEREMLKAFAEHHKLKYRLFTLATDKNEKVHEGYKVGGIPQAVLIDRKGMVRLVKVGAGEENAKALEETIKKLLAEK